MSKKKSPPGLRVHHLLKGHEALINQLTWSPDGKWLATASSDWIIKIWDMQTGNEVHRLATHFAKVETIAWSPDGQILAASDADNVIILWDTVTWKILKSFSEQIYNVHSLVWSPDSKTVACALESNEVYLLKVEEDEPVRIIKGIFDVVDIAWSPDGKRLALASIEWGVLLWDIKSNSLEQILKSHIGALVVAWSPDGEIIASGTKSGTIQLWESITGREAGVIEGHLSSVTTISFSPDSSYIASRSFDGTIRICQCSSWQNISYLNDFPSKGAAPLSFSPMQQYLATLTNQGKTVCIWKVNFSVLERAKPIVETVHLVSAKIVLVGESNVGKSCLALRLAEDRYDETILTTHGMQFWSILPTRLYSADELPVSETREIVVWDMGGQDEYKLVHQLFLHDTTLALFLFDPTRGRVAFEEVEAWNKRLEKQLQGRKATKILIGSKQDKDSSVIDYRRIERLVNECDFAGYYATSARTGRGIEELKKAIANSLDWDTLSKISRPELFQRIRDEVELLRSDGEIVIAQAELQKRVYKKVKRFLDPSTSAVVKQLALQGVIVNTQLVSGKEVIVLQIGEIERYAGSIIIAARNNPRGIPALEEQAIASQRMSFPGIERNERPKLSQEKIILECVVQLLLEHGICLKHEGLLIFPSLFQPSEDAITEKLQHSISLYYDFSGAIDNIYSSLVAKTAISEQFGGMRLWEDRAEFEKLGQGVCGIRKIDRGNGLAHLDIYFEDKISDEVKNLFLSFVDHHLRIQGLDIFEHVEITCICTFQFSEESIRKRLADGASDIGCPDCDQRTKISEGAQKARQLDPKLEQKTWALKTNIDKKTKLIIQESKSNFGQPVIRNVGALPIRILHLSDLHINAETELTTIFNPLVFDLSHEFGDFNIRKLDYLVISGDLTNQATPKEFEKAREFVSWLIGEYGLTSERCIIIPGNHDLSWAEPVYNWNGRRRNDIANLKEGTFVEQPKVLGVRNENDYKLRFKNFSEYFFHPLIQQEYPLEYDKQCIPYLFFEDRLQFLAMNSCWEIDEYYPNRSSLSSSALAKGIDAANKQIEKAKLIGRIPQNEPVLRLGVWHHPVTGNEKIIQDSFLQRLNQADVRLCLHGHIHEVRADVVGYYHPKMMHIVGAGSFGAPMRDRPETTPRLYNLLEISRDLQKIKVHTRSLPKADGAWEGWAVWPTKGKNKHLKQTFYEISLSSKKS